MYLRSLRPVYINKENATFIKSEVDANNLDGYYKDWMGKMKDPRTEKRDTILLMLAIWLQQEKLGGSDRQILCRLCGKEAPQRTYARLLLTVYSIALSTDAI